MSHDPDAHDDPFGDLGSELPDFLQPTPLPPDADAAALDALRADLSSADVAVALGAVARVRAEGRAALQVEVAELLLAQGAGAGHEGVQAILDCLDELGDARVIRALEAALHARAAELSEHHAWRARHIIQRIRRGGRG